MSHQVIENLRAQVSQYQADNDRLKADVVRASSLGSRQIVKLEEFKTAIDGLKTRLSDQERLSKQKAASKALTKRQTALTRQAE